MAIKQDLSTPKLGMNRDTYPGELTKDEYVFALNANIHNENGGGKVILQNENSNIKCSGFKEGYKVVGHIYDQVDELTYFFLTNPTTGFSEIGVISSIPEAFDMSPTETTDNKGSIVVALETPLEDLPQEATCTYETLVSDLCESGSQQGSKCLNFSIEDPFQPKDIFIKHGKRGKTLWFSHQRNPMRFLQIDRLSIYTDVVDPCDDVVTNVCLDCDKLRVFPLFTRPCITAEAVVGGGALKAGNYEITLAYSDILGNELTDYSPATNPVRIFDRYNNILDQTLLDYKTNQAIKVSLANLDQDFEYYRLAVVYTSGLDGTKTVYEFGVFPINQDLVTVYDLDNNSKLDSKSIFYRRPYYETAYGQAVSNGYMYYYGLTTQRTINLQPVVNLMGAFVKWGTYMAKESLYLDGAATANYAGYHRNEVYPAALEFELEGGYITPRFPLIARPPEAGELDLIDTVETQSVLKYNPECFESDRQQRWQFENTAYETDVCEVADGIPTNEIEKEVVSTCIIAEESGQAVIVETLEDSTVTLPSGYTDLVNYINNNKDLILASSDPNFADIKDILENPDTYTETCTPIFGTDCEEPATLVSEEMIALSIEGEVENSVEADLDFTNYPPIPLNTAPCGGYERDSNGNVIRDTDFETDFMESTEIVYKKTTPGNTFCLTATDVLEYTSPPIPVHYHLQHKGELNTIGTLQQTLDTDIVNTTIVITFSGTAGQANLNIGGTNYLLDFTTNLPNTLAVFVSTHGPTIDGLTVTSNVNKLTLSGVEGSFLLPTLTNTTGDYTMTFDNQFYTGKIHSNAVWFKVNFNGASKKLFQFGTAWFFDNDNNGTPSVRLSVFDSCSATANISGYGGIINDITVDNTAKFIMLDADDFGGTSGSAYIVVDTPLRSRMLVGISDILNTLMTPVGCFNAYTRDAIINTSISFTALNFGKKQTYSTTCTFEIPILNNCNALPYKKGKFSYWQSTEVYPCNKELFDSSELEISTSDIPLSIRNDFENYFTSGSSGGQYTLTTDTDFRDKNIRHFKFPDNEVAPFMSTADQVSGDFGESVIYPIGFVIDAEVVSAFLDIAVKNGLLTQEERRRIVNYRVYRGDRRIHKSVVAKGIMFDMYSYNDANQNETIYFPNYPLNTLGIDVFSNTPHPYGSTSNKFFTFHSPDTDYADYGIQRPSLTRELYVDGYLFGKSATEFDTVEDYPTYSLLGSKSYDAATSLAWTEVGFEFLLQSSNWLVLAGTGGLSALAAGLLAATAIIATGTASVFKAGEYRYKWLETFRNLGRPINYAYYGTALGYYNYYKPNQLPFQKLRGLTVNTYLREGFKRINNEPDQQEYKVNALQRERAVLMHTGTYPILYSPDYVTYDNATLDEATSSRFRVPDLIGRSGKIIGNTAVPYGAIMQYNPSQWGTIDGITWINTGFCGSLESYSDCDVVFGGDIFITRHSLKRKIPHFRTNAFGLAPLTPFKHSDYFNINPPLATLPSSSITTRYFLDYQVNDSASNFTAAILYPGQKSYYNLDNGGNDMNEFYVKAKNKFYLYSYGIPHFLVESEIICDYRYAKREKHENFYPNIQDVIEFTQEKNVSIKEPNTFFYNSIYSNTPTPQPGVTLPVNFESALYNDLNSLENTIIYTQQDLSERGVREPWRSVKVNDTFNFSDSYGKLISVVPIESSQILVRFENGFTIYGSIDPIRDKLTPEVGNLGSGGIFLGRPVNFNVTDIGYAGTQHKMIISSEAGHLWADAKRGKFHLLAPNGKNLDEVSRSQNTLNASLEKWFKENLPFKILRTFPNLNVDNSYNNIGLTGVWDDRFKRYIVTKLDYTVNDTNGLVVIDGNLYDQDRADQIISDTEEDGWTYIEVIGNTLYFEQTSESVVCPCITFNYMFNGTVFNETIPPSGTVNGYNSFYLTTNGINCSVEVSDTGVWTLYYGEDRVVFATLPFEGTPTCPTGEWDVETICQCVQFQYSTNLGVNVVVFTVTGTRNGRNLFTATVGGNSLELAWDGVDSWVVTNVTTSTEIAYLGYDSNCPTGSDWKSSPPIRDVASVSCSQLEYFNTTACADETGETTYLQVELPPLDTSNDERFTPCSWTVAYNPYLKSWISYYSYKPNYYIGYNDYFQSGINFGEGFGVWSHLPFTSTYQVFYGVLYPFIVEYPVVSQLVTSQLASINYWLDVRKYYDRHNFTDIFGVGFNKAVVYNNFQNSGLLELVPQQTNNIRQNLLYPKHKTNSIEILQTEINGRWSFNYLYNTIKTERAGLPIWLEDCAQIEKVLDDRLLNYKSMRKDYLRGDYFLVRLIQDAESRFKFMLRWSIQERDLYED